MGTQKGQWEKGKRGKREKGEKKKEKNIKAIPEKWAMQQQQTNTSCTKPDSTALAKYNTCLPMSLPWVPASLVAVLKAARLANTKAAHH